MPREARTSDGIVTCPFEVTFTTFMEIFLLKVRQRARAHSTRRAPGTTRSCCRTGGLAPPGNGSRSSFQPSTEHDGLRGKRYSARETGPEITLPNPRHPPTGLPGLAVTPPGLRDVTQKLRMMMKRQVRPPWPSSTCRPRWFLPSQRRQTSGSAWNTLAICPGGRAAAPRRGGSVASAGHGSSSSVPFNDREGDSPSPRSRTSRACPR